MIDTDRDLPASVLERALERARALMDASAVPSTRSERRTRERLRRLFEDPDAVKVTITLTDEVMRFTSAASAARALRAAATRASTKGFGALNALGLRAVASLSYAAPTLTLRVVRERIRHLTANLIVDDEPANLTAVFSAHRRAGMALNVNVLGEAVLGEREADDRLARVLAMVRRGDVNYVSVKLSSVVSQLTTIDRAGSLARVSERLRLLYRDARACETFVNLDMEEFRDLRLTLDAFVSVLSESEFRAISAGVVLQAYLPEAHGALEELLDFARRRHDEGGGVIKVRLVKGANLAMEEVESELHEWRAAPYGSKPDVDASYLRLIDVALRPEHADFLRVGVASHNLFHVAWALELARARGVLAQVDVEMLEGMANAEAAALVADGQPVLLYAPVARRDDFASAVSYLVRRLDENTAPENYLRAALFIARDAEVFEDQRQRFLTALESRHSVSPTSRRTALVPRADAFSNEPDGDPANLVYVREVSDALAAVNAEHDVVIDSLTRLEGAGTAEFESGHDPNDAGATWYRYRVAGIDEIDQALEFASSGFATWHRMRLDERQAVLRRCAEVMSAARSRTIAVMARDGGKTVAEADPEVSEGTDFARFYSAHAVGDDASTPMGVVLVVPPWNFPYAIPAGGVLAALAAGNAVVLKPAPEAVAVAFELVSQLWRAGVPRDVLQMVPTRDDDGGRHLVTHVGVSAVVLTGSFETASLFTSWKPTLRLLAETSGKNAMVITAAADIDLAVKDLVQSAFGHAGQKCSAASLAIVERSVIEDPRFLAQLVDAVTTLNVGTATELATNVGPIIRAAEAPLQRALTQLDDGESWLVSPQSLDEAQLRWRPGVKLGVQPGSWSHLHEWFGPVLGVMVAKDLKEATTWQNQTPYALTAGLHSLDQSECEWWIEAVEAGNLYLNRGTTGAVVHRQPFGGWKRSSVGPTAKAGGRHYVNALRNWTKVTELDGALELASTWWRERGARALDEVGLRSEANIARYRFELRPVVVRVDPSFSAIERDYLRGLVELSGIRVEFSAERPVPGLFDVTLEAIDGLVARASSLSRVRWLSAESAPTLALLQEGVNLDPRPLAQAGDVELPRWLLEQSVAITNHRYGNVHAGPKPRCRGL
jgi:RHH-type proline utilization regulon transcriptional repressor/proline dehydrogenase/delta 1-pyrroline-5-carboxylate dehydrogenase